MDAIEVDGTPGPRVTALSTDDLVRDQLRTGELEDRPSGRRIARARNLERVTAGARGDDSRADTGRSRKGPGQTATASRLDEAPETGCAGGSEPRQHALKLSLRPATRMCQATSPIVPKPLATYIARGGLCSS